MLIPGHPEKPQLIPPWSDRSVVRMDRQGSESGAEDFSNDSKKDHSLTMEETKKITSQQSKQTTKVVPQIMVRN